MSKSCKVLGVVTVVYLASGLVNMMMHPGVLAVAQLVYVACFVIGALAALAAFTGPAKRYRALGLWSVAPLIPVVRTNDWRIVFPGLAGFPMTFPMAVSRRAVCLGVDGAPLLLLVLILAFTEKLIKEQQAAQAKSQGHVGHGHA